MTKVAESSHISGASAAFLSLDDRIPMSVRDLLLEADGCVGSGFMNGGTACAQRAVEALLKYEKAEGATYDARVRALGEKHSVIPQLLLTVLLQFGDGAARDSSKLTSNTLQLLVVTLKAVVYEIYVVGPDRLDRLQHVRRILEATERKGGTAPTAAPAAAAAQG